MNFLMQQLEQRKIYWEREIKRCKRELEEAEESVMQLYDDMEHEYERDRRQKEEDQRIINKEKERRKELGIIKNRDDSLESLIIKDAPWEKPIKAYLSILDNCWPMVSVRSEMQDKWVGNREIKYEIFLKRKRGARTTSKITKMPVWAPAGTFNVKVNDIIDGWIQPEYRIGKEEFKGLIVTLGPSIVKADKVGWLRFQLIK